MDTNKSAVTLLLAAIAFSTSSFDDDNDVIKDAIDPGDNDSRWVVGAAAFSQKSIFSGESDHLGVLPAFRYNGDKFFSKNGSLNYSLGQKNRFTYGVTARYSSSLLAERHEYADNPALAGLQERDGNFDGGFYLNHTTDQGRFHFSLLTDLQGKHDGQSAVAQYSLDLSADRWVK